MELTASRRRVHAFNDQFHLSRPLPRSFSLAAAHLGLVSMPVSTEHRAMRPAAGLRDFRGAARSWLATVPTPSGVTTTLRLILGWQFIGYAANRARLRVSAGLVLLPLARRSRYDRYRAPVQRSRSIRTVGWHAWQQARPIRALESARPTPMSDANQV